MSKENQEKVIDLTGATVVPPEVYEHLSTAAEKVRAIVDWAKAYEKENGLKSEEKSQK